MKHWKLNGGTHGYAKQPKTLRLLLELMFETGMRVGDAIRYDPLVAVKGDHLWIYTFIPQKKKKTDQPKPLEIYLTDRLKIAIDQCDWLSPKGPFIYGSFRNQAYLANEVYYRMQTIGERCGVEDCRPHRLRDTFAVRPPPSRSLGLARRFTFIRCYSFWLNVTLSQPAGDIFAERLRGDIIPDRHHYVASWITPLAVPPPTAPRLRMPNFANRCKKVLRLMFR